MPYDIRIIRGRDFIRLDGQGHTDLQTARQLLCDAMWACVNSHIGRVLIDVREATPSDLTGAQLCVLAQVSREVAVPPDVHKLAILNRPRTDIDGAAMVAASARDEGWNIQAFREFEAAFDWLIT